MADDCQVPCHVMIVHTYIGNWQGLWQAWRFVSACFTIQCEDLMHAGSCNTATWLKPQFKIQYDSCVFQTFLHDNFTCVQNLRCERC